MNGCAARAPSASASLPAAAREPGPGGAARLRAESDAGHGDLQAKGILDALDDRRETDRLLIEIAVHRDAELQAAFHERPPGLERPEREEALLDRTVRLAGRQEAV